MLQLAQAAEIGSNGTLLGGLISGSLIITAIAAYNFVVKIRLTERGMARQRLQQANRGERAAQREAALWQLRCGDLEYKLALAAGASAVPPLSDELKKLVDSNETSADHLKLIDGKDAIADTGGRPAP